MDCSVCDKTFYQLLFYGELGDGVMIMHSTTTTGLLILSSVFQRSLPNESNKTEAPNVHKLEFVYSSTSGA